MLQRSDLLFLVPSAEQYRAHQLQRCLTCGAIRPSVLSSRLLVSNFYLGYIKALNNFQWFYLPPGQAGNIAFLPQYLS